MSERQEPRHIEVQGDSVEMAIQLGLERLGLTRAEVTVEVLDEGGRGVLGIGGRAARVRLTEGDVPYETILAAAQAAEAAAAERLEASSRQTPETTTTRTAQAQPSRPVRASQEDDEVRTTEEILHEILDRLHIQATMDVRQAEPSGDESESPWVIDIQGDDLGVLIGRRGETLGALQYITRLIVSRELQRRANIVIDVEGYKTRRETTLRRLAQRMAEEARTRGRTVKLEPMPPNERRIIHIALRNDPTVTTESEGFGDRRKVTIKPRTDR